jgi:hypothetical protein
LEALEIMAPHLCQKKSVIDFLKDDFKAHAAVCFCVHSEGNFLPDLKPHGLRVCLALSCDHSMLGHAQIVSAIAGKQRQ